MGNASTALVVCRGRQDGTVSAEQDIVDHVRRQHQLRGDGRGWQEWAIDRAQLDESAHAHVGLLKRDCTAPSL